MLAVAISGANVADSAGARAVLPQLTWDSYPRLTTVFADAAYAKPPLIDWTADALGLSVAIVPKLDGQTTFVVRPKRWIVERTFAWLMHYRRLHSDYETTTASGVGWIHTAMIHLMVRRLAE